MSTFWCGLNGKVGQSCQIEQEETTFQVDSAEEVGQAEPADQRDQAMEEACAICFEVGPFIALPCACNVHYCAACWDRSLARSSMVRGLPSCPSCRQSFTADYSDAAGGLIFSIASEDTARGDEWRRNLTKKARPVQIRRLRDHGEALLTCSGQEGSSTLASTSNQVPKCACGGHLELNCRRGRILRMLDDTDPDWRTRCDDTESPLKRLLASAIITCDLCEGIAVPPYGVWTCSNGPHTVLHPEGEDICEACFQRHVGYVAPKAMHGCTSGCYCQKGATTQTSTRTDAGDGCAIQI